MPNINRIRVNNVKYNFGTQSYDDFIMKMYGRDKMRTIFLTKYNMLPVGING